MGMPLSIVDKEYFPDAMPPLTPRKTTTKRKFDLEKNKTSKTEKIKSEPKDNYDTDSSKNDDDDDDLDWL